MKIEPRPHSSKRARPFVRLAMLAGAAALVCALWWGPSAALRYTLDRSFATIGYRVVGMGQVAVSLFERRIDVERVELEQPGGGRVQLDLADLHISPTALFSGRIEVPRARIAGLSLDVARASDGTIRIAGLPVVAPSSPKDAPAPAASMLAIGISDFELSASRIVLRGGGTRTEIAVRRLVVDGFVLGDPSARMRFELDATVGGRPLKLAGTAMPFAAAPTLDAHLDADALALGPLAQLFGHSFAGTLDAALDIKFAGDRPANTRLAADGTIALRGVSAADATAASLSWRGGLTLSEGYRFQGKGVLDGVDVRLADAAARIALDTIRYDGTFDAAAVGSSIVAGGTLELRGLGLSDGGSSEFSIQTLRLDTPRLAYGADGNVGGRVTLESTTLAGKAAAGAVRIATLQGQGDISAGLRTQSFDGIIEIVAPNFERAGERYAADRIGVESVRLSRSDDSGTLRGAVAIDGLAAKTADIDLTAAKARYEGSVDLRPDGATASGKVSGEKIRANISAAEIVATLDAVLYDGSLATAPDFVTDGRVRLGALSVIDATARELFAAASLDLGDFGFGPAGTRALRVAIAEPRLLRREKAIEGREAFGWRLRAPRASLEDARVAADGGVAVGTLRVEQPTIRITRTKSGFLSFERGAPPVPGAPPAARSPGLSVGRFEILNGRGIFEDRTPHDTVRIPLDRLALTVTDLDDRRPERPSSVSLAARVGTFGEAKIGGAVFPFAPLLSFDIEFAARAIDLPPISAYADEALGVDVRTGTATVEGRLVAREEKLDGKTKWRIANIRLDERETGTESLAAKTGVPIGTALALLADDDDNIELEVPIAGELSNPSFDTADAVRQAVGGAVRGALSGTLSVLFPFGSIFSAVVDSDRRGTGLKLPVVSFAAGASALEGDVVAVVDGLAKLLAARPAARLEVCGFAGPPDVAALPRRQAARAVTDEEDVLRRLAAARAEAVKRRLVENDKVDPARVFECRPVVEEADDAKPRAELRF